ncbi:N-acyl-D-amino-acid deacylase family protein [Microbacterium esteraromaticum]|uniref:N-acyl-D-amino-acid deacylase family protein n=1 Tax=Microbacterium esteraromaticum TaxID=57043 RepID=UPI001959AD94|nr:amidohydrolase family protein [Microbacterium esteraromaticum]MBM7466198.1 N-acyl-D-amino-acid deacylase [Microbacterium esteraromaticum]
MSGRTVLRGGSVVASGDVVAADVAIEGDLIVAVGDVDSRPDDRVIDATGRLVLPGFIDAHSHADGMLRDPDVTRALLRQGVTTIIGGQDGVSYAPGDGAYASGYFAAINGPHPTYSGGGIAELLDAVDGASALNAGYLVPAGTVRFEVCGRSSAVATDAERRRMVALVEQGMADGALGLSTGLDYVPGIFQDAEEIAALCTPVARAGGVYVSHMRGGYEANTAAGIAEMVDISRRAAADAGAALPVHVSHLHADADIVLEQLDAFAAAGVEATFDAYPYIRGCTLLGMPLLPPEISALPVDEVVALLGDPLGREALRDTCVQRASNSPSLGPDWPDMITLAHIAASDFAWAHGLTLREAAARAGADPMHFALDLLAASRMESSAVMAVRNPRPATELARIFAHPGHIGGSDGIWVGAHPHPRAAGSFARYLREFVRELGTWTWADAVHHLSAQPARRFGLGRRGVIEEGAIADVLLVDPETVADGATYEQPRTLATGIDDVFVAGVQVLAGGEPTGALPGRGLRHEPRRDVSRGDA